MNPLVLAAIIFLATFVNTVGGFGFGLLAMGLLSGLVDIHTAAPTVALISTVVYIGILFVYRQSFDFRAVARLVLGALVGVPVGVWLLAHFDPTLILRILGLLLIGYAVYGLFGLKPPRIERPAFAYPFGFISGILGGLYNIGGPPVVIYGTCRDWEPNTFRSNLQGFFFASNAFVLVSHLVSHNFTPAVLSDTAIGLPFAALGIASGVLFERHLLQPLLFRRLVYGVLILTGLRLLL